MKQTAVEWLKLKIESIEFQDPAAGQLYLEIQPLIEQAKAMEKAEKDKQYQRGFKDGSNHIKIIFNL